MNVLRVGLCVCVIGTCSVLPLNSSFAEQPDEILTIWPGDPPGEKIDVGPEQDITKDTDPLIAGRRIIKLANVKVPQAHVFLPPANLRTGASVVICPGGGFSILAWDLEGTEVAQWLNTLGVAGIVLKYRVPTREQDQPWLPPTQDVQRTISLVRQNAEKWKLDPEKVASLGFSAGGVAALGSALAGKRYYDSIDETDSFACHPNRLILIYSGGLPKDSAESTLNQLNITKETPPMFIVHAFDDFVPVQGTANLLLALKQAGVPTELHVYDAGGHGYGLRPRDDLPVTSWTDPCEAWLRRAKWID